MPDTYYVMPFDVHRKIISAGYQQRGYSRDEGELAARAGELASRHGVRTHNAIKALHLDHLFGAAAGGCVPGATIEKLPSRFKAVQRWNANKKLGQAVALEAMDTCMKLADEFGIGAVAVDNAFHYLWGGGYAIDAASKGYIAYTCCTAALAEVVPFGGKFPTLGTNPHSWAFPTTDAVGFPITIDWATSTVSMGRVQQFAREGKTLPEGIAVDAAGKLTTNPNEVVALLPFAAHKGYGLSMVDELFGAYTGGSLPTLRSRWGTGAADEKHTPTFYFQCIHPQAISGDNFAQRRSQDANVKAVIQDILGHGNESCLLPGQMEANAAKLTHKYGGLLFSKAEVSAFADIAHEAGVSFNMASLKQIEI